MYQDIINSGTVEIGKGCYFHPTVVLNAPVFRLVFIDGKSSRQVMDHQPRTFIGNRVHIFANSSIEGGWDWGTIIGNDVFIDNNILIGHDSILEDRVCIAGSTVLGGKVTIRKDTFIGIGCSISPGVTIGKRCFIGSGTSVYKDIPNGMVVRNKMEILMKPNEQYPPNSLDIYPDQPKN